MIIKNATFCIGAVSPEQYPKDSFFEIALCGRSNVGKSSLINKLINRKKLARTSSQPGKTQELNYYNIDSNLGRFYIVDLPGYGYAKVSKKERERWSKFMETYLLERSVLACIFQVLDLRHPPSKDDINMYSWLRYYEKKVHVIATKGDKVSKSRWLSHQQIIKKQLNCSDLPIIFSSETGYGKDKLNQLIEDYYKAISLF